MLAGFLVCAHARAEGDGGVPDAALVEPTPAYGATAQAPAPARSAGEVSRSHALLSAAPHRTGSDMLLVLPGMFVTQHSGEGKAHQLFFRGFDAVHGQDLELWVGGAPVNEVSNLHGQGYADLHFVMPETVRSLRAAPGPYDPRQGDFAVAGSVHYELGLDEPGMTAKVGLGSFGGKRVFLAYRPHAQGEESFGAAELYETDGFGPSRAARRASGSVQHVLQLSDDTRLRVLLVAYASDFDSAGVLRLVDIERGAVGRFATYQAGQGGASQRLQLVTDLTHKLGPSSLGVAPYVVLRSLDLRQNFTGHLLDSDGDTSAQHNDDVALGGRAYYRVKQRVFSPGDSAEVGLALRSDRVAQSQLRVADDGAIRAREVDATLRALDVAAYVDVSFRPVAAVTVRGGVRLDGLAYSVDDGEGPVRSTQGMHVGKKLSVAGLVRDDLQLIASYGEGFRSPQARSLAEDEATPFTRVWSCEGGFRYEPRTLSVSAAGFRTWLSDDLVFDPVTTRNERVPATARTGAALDATYKPLSWVVLNANGTYTHAVFRRSDRQYAARDLVPYVPQLVLRADAGVNPSVATWRGRTLTVHAGAGLSYLGRRPLPYDELGADVFLVDAQLRVRLGEVALGFTAYNLFDARWYDGQFTFASNWAPGERAASLVPERHVTVGAPRTLFATLELML